MTTHKIIQKLEIEVRTVEQAAAMWQRILKSVFANKFGYNQATDVGIYLETKFGSEILN